MVFAVFRLQAAFGVGVGEAGFGFGEGGGHFGGAAEEPDGFEAPGDGAELAGGHVADFHRDGGAGGLGFAVGAHSGDEGGGCGNGAGSADGGSNAQQGAAAPEQFRRVGFQREGVRHGRGPARRGLLLAALGALADDNRVAFVQFAAGAEDLPHAQAKAPVVEDIHALHAVD